MARQPTCLGCHQCLYIYGNIGYLLGLMSRKITTTVYITEDQQRLLKTLNTRSKVPIAEYIRQGIDLILQENKDLLPGQMELEHLPPGKATDSVDVATTTSRSDS